jgi:hypothetical protein
MSQSRQPFQPMVISSSPVQRPSGEPVMDRSPQGSNQEKWLEFVSLVEDVLFVRWQNLGNGPADDVERLAMKRIADDLLAIKTHELGWPEPCRSKIHNS